MKKEYLKTITAPQVLYNDVPQNRYSNLNFKQGFLVNNNETQGQNEILVDDDFINESIATLNQSFTGGTWSKDNVPTKVQFGTIVANNSVNYTINVAQGTQISKLFFISRHNDALANFNITKIVSYTVGDIESLQNTTETNVEIPGFEFEIDVSTSGTIITVNFSNKNGFNTNYIAYHFAETINLT